VASGATVNYAADNADGAAVKAARSSDVAVVVVGNHPTCGATNIMAIFNMDVSSKPCADPGEGREGRDRESIDLSQEELIKQVYAANPKTVVVLVSSFPYAINWTQQNVPAILHIAHAAQEQGTAIADVLFGDYNPAGRLNQTWPKSLDQLPPMMDYDIRHGRTYTVLQRRAALSFRVWIELHDLPILTPAGRLGNGQRGCDQHRNAGRRRSGATLCAARGIEATARIPARLAEAAREAHRRDAAEGRAGNATRGGRLVGGRVCPANYEHSNMRKRSDTVPNRPVRLFGGPSDREAGAVARQRRRDCFVCTAAGCHRDFFDARRRERFVPLTPVLSSPKSTVPKSASGKMPPPAGAAGRLGNPFGRRPLRARDRSSSWCKTCRWSRPSMVMVNSDPL
jgi:hypothetical protein